MLGAGAGTVFCRRYDGRVRTPFPPHFLRSCGGLIPTASRSSVKLVSQQGLQTSQIGRRRAHPR